MKKKIYLSLLFIMGLLLFPIGVNASSGDVLCKIGEVEFSDIATAIETAKDGDEIILVKDMSSKVEIPAGKKITLNLNNKKVTATLTTGIKNSGTLTIKNGSIYGGMSASGIENLENATLTMDAIKCEDVSTGLCLKNNGTAQIINGTFSSEENANLIKNLEKGKLTITSGTYTSKLSNFQNYGEMIINNGTFEATYNLNTNENYGKLTINNGTFNVPNSYAITNTAGEVFINGGTFNCKSVAQNYDPNYAKDNYTKTSKIAVTGGTFNTTSTAFANASFSLNSTILLNGGKINMSGEDYVISEHNGKNTIQIIKTNIDAFKSKGLFLNYKSTFIIGEDDGTVKKDTPLINIPNGTIAMSGTKGTFKFYDGTINLKSKINQNTVQLTTPKNYYVSYDTNKDKTLNAYLKDKKQSVTTVTVEDKNHAKVENPKTGEFNIVYLSILAIFMILGIGISSKKIFQNK